jgi:hypothetical protein
MRKGNNPFLLISDVSILKEGFYPERISEAGLYSLRSINDSHGSSLGCSDTVYGAGTGFVSSQLSH